MATTAKVTSKQLTQSVDIANHAWIQCAHGHWQWLFNNNYNHHAHRLAMSILTIRIAAIIATITMVAAQFAKWTWRRISIRTNHLSIAKNYASKNNSTIIFSLSLGMLLLTTSNANHQQQMEITKLAFQRPADQQDIHHNNSNILPYLKIGMVGMHKKVIHTKLESNLSHLNEVGVKAEKSYVDFRSKLLSKFGDDKTMKLAFLNDSDLDQDLKIMKSTLATLMKLEGLVKHNNNNIPRNHLQQQQQFHKAEQDTFWVNHPNLARSMKIEPVELVEPQIVTQPNLDRPSIARELGMDSSMLKAMNLQPRIQIPKPMDLEQDNNQTRFKRNLVVDLNPGSIIREAIVGISNALNYPTLKKIAERQDVQEISMHHLKQAMEKMVSKLDSIDNDVATLFAFNYKASQKLNIRMIVNKKKHDLRIIFRDITNQASNILKSLPFLNKGVVTVDLVPLEVAENVMQSIKDDVSHHGQELITKEYMDMYLCPASFYIKNMVLHMVWHTDSIDKKRKMTLYEWIPAPIMYIEKHYKLVNIPRFIGITSGLLQDMEAIQIQDLDKECRAFRNGMYTCNNQIPVLKKIANFCLPSIIAGIKAPCEAIEIKDPQPEFYWSKTKVLALFLPAREPIYTKCEDSPGITSFQQGIVMKSIGERCTLSTRGWRFATDEMVAKSSFQATQINDFAHVLEPTFAELAVEDQPNPWLEPSSISNATNFTSIIKQHLQQVITSPHDMVQQNSNMVKIAFGAAMAALILWAISAAYVIFKVQQIQIHPEHDDPGIWRRITEPVRRVGRWIIETCQCHHPEAPPPVVAMEMQPVPPIVVPAQPVPPIMMPVVAMPQHPQSV